MSISNTAKSKISRCPSRYRNNFTALRFACVLSLFLAGVSLSTANAQNGTVYTPPNSKPAAKETKKGEKMNGKQTKPKTDRTKMVMLPTRTILVFPPDTKGGASDQLTDVITNTEQGRIGLTTNYQSLFFIRSIPSVRRALSEASLTTADISHPFDSDAKLKRVSQNAGYDMVLVTSIDDYTYDAAKNQVNMTISARLIDFSGDKPIVRAAAESGKSPDGTSNIPEVKLALGVARSIADRLMTQLLTPGKRTPTPAPSTGASTGGGGAIK
jgi:hypothetical protein